MGMQSFVSSSDLHGDRRDHAAVSAFKRFVDDFQPKFRVFKGDLWDMRAIREGASKAEKLHSLERDFRAGIDFIEWYQPNVITLGNHDVRLYDLIMKDGVHKSGPLTDLAKRYTSEFEALAKKMGALVLPYDKRRGIYRRNGLGFTHGISAGKDAATEMARLYGDVLFGHIHAFDVATEPDQRGPRVAMSTGCLCQLDMTYNRTHGSTLRQQHGWLYGAFHGTRGHTTFPAVLDRGQVIYAEHLKKLSV